jgi:hypothetical protein
MSEKRNGWVKDYIFGYERSIHYKNGKKHKEDGPAWIRRGTIGYYKEGKIHREDGPAIINNDGRRFYYLEDIRYPNPNSELDWLLTVKKWKLDVDNQKKLF